MTDPVTGEIGQAFDLPDGLPCCAGGRCARPFETPLLEVALKGLWRFVARRRAGDEEPASHDTTGTTTEAEPRPPNAARPDRRPRGIA